MAFDATFWVAVSFVIFFWRIDLFKNSTKNKRITYKNDC